MPARPTISPSRKDNQRDSSQTLASERATEGAAHPLLAAHLTSSSSSSTPLLSGATDATPTASHGQSPKEGASQMATAIGLAQQEQQPPPPPPSPPGSPLSPPKQPPLLQHSLAHNHQNKEPPTSQDVLVGGGGAKANNKRPYSVSPKSSVCHQCQTGDKDILETRDIPLQAPPTDTIHHHNAPTTVNQTAKLIKLDHDLASSPLVLSAPPPPPPPQPQDSQTALGLAGFRGGRQSSSSSSSSSSRLQQTLTNSANNGTRESTIKTGLATIMTSDHYGDQRDRSSTTALPPPPSLPPTLAPTMATINSTSQQLDLSETPIFETLENVRIPAYVIDGEPYLGLPKLLQFLEEKFPLKTMVKKFEESMICFTQATYKQVEGFKRLKMIPDSADSCPLIKRSDADRICLELYEQCHEVKRNDIVGMCTKTDTLVAINATTNTRVAKEMPPLATSAATNTNTTTIAVNATGSSKQYDQIDDSKQQTAAAARQDPSITGIINISNGVEQVGFNNRSQSDDKEEQLSPMEPICMVRPKVYSQSTSSNQNNSSTSSSSSSSSSLSSSTSSLADDRQHQQQLETSPSRGNKCNNSEQEKWASEAHGSETNLKQSQSGLIFETNEAQKSILALARAVSSTLMIRVYHKCFGKCGGLFYPSLLVTSKSQCIECINCHVMLAPRRFIGHTHGPKENDVCHWGFNSLNWRYYIRLSKKQTMNNLDDEELVLQFKILQSVPDDAQTNDEDDNFEIDGQQFDSKEIDKLNLKFYQQTTTTSLNVKDSDSNTKLVDKDYIQKQQHHNHHQQNQSIHNSNESNGIKNLSSSMATLPINSSMSFDEKSWNLSQQFIQQQSNYLLNALSGGTATSAAIGASSGTSSSAVYRHNVHSPFYDRGSSLSAAPTYHSSLSMTTPSYCTRANVNPYYSLPSTTLAQDCYNKMAENYGFGQHHQISRTSSLGMDPRQRYGGMMGGSSVSSGSSSNGSGITANASGISHRNMFDIMPSLPMESSTSHHNQASNWLPSSRPLSVADSDLTSMGSAHTAYNTLQFEKELKCEMFVSSSLNAYLNELGISSSVAGDIVSHTLNSMRKSKLLF